MSKDKNTSLVTDVLDELAILKVVPTDLKSITIKNIQTHLKDFDLTQGKQSDVLIYSLKLIAFDSGLSIIKKSFALSTIAEKALSALHKTTTKTGIC